MACYHYETIYDIETNTKKSVKFFEYFNSVCIFATCSVQALRKKKCTISTSSGGSCSVSIIPLLLLLNHWTYSSRLLLCMQYDITTIFVLSLYICVLFISFSFALCLYSVGPILNLHPQQVHHNPSHFIIDHISEIVPFHQHVYRKNKNS